MSKNNKKTINDSTNNLRKLIYNMLATSSVILFEGAIGVITGSLSLLGDAAHSCVDLVSSIVSFVFLRVSLRPADKNHLYGHGKIEYVGTLVGGFTLLFLGTLLAYDSIVSIINLEEKTIGSAAYIALAYVFLAEAFRTTNSYFGSSMGKGKSLLKSEFYHALADMSGTFVALLGVLLNDLGVKGSDELGGLILSLLITYGSLKLMYGAAMELTDYIPKEILPKVTKAVQGTRGVVAVKEIRARKSGDAYYIDTVVTVSNKLKIEDAHEIASDVEQNVKKVLPKSDVTVHVEPENKKGEE